MSMATGSSPCSASLSSPAWTRTMLLPETPTMPSPPSPPSGSVLAPPPSPPTLPTPSLTYLAQLNMELSLTTEGRRGLAMTVHHRQTKASWRHCHSLRDYRALQRRLVAALAPGHDCPAQCRELAAAVEASVLSPSRRVVLAGWAAPGLLEQHRVELVAMLETLQAGLLDPRNHSCPYLIEAVATELVAFLYGEPQHTTTAPWLVPHGHRRSAATTTTTATTTDSSPMTPQTPKEHPWAMSSPSAALVRGLSSAFSDADDEDDDAHDASSSLESQDGSGSMANPENEDDRDRHARPCCLEETPAMQGPPSTRSSTGGGPVGHTVVLLTSWRRAARGLIRRRTSSADTTAFSTTPRATSSLSSSLVSPVDHGTSPKMPMDDADARDDGIPACRTYPANAVLSPRRSYHPSTGSRRPSQVPKLSTKATPSSTGRTTVSLLKSLYQRVQSPMVAPFSA